VAHPIALCFMGSTIVVLALFRPITMVFARTASFQLKKGDFHIQVEVNVTHGWTDGLDVSYEGAKQVNHT
jgi:hypothetical protein